MKQVNKGTLYLQLILQLHPYTSLEGSNNSLLYPTQYHSETRETVNYNQASQWCYSIWVNMFELYEGDIWSSQGWEIECCSHEVSPLLWAARDVLWQTRCAWVVCRRRCWNWRLQDPLVLHSPRIHLTPEPPLRGNMSTVCGNSSSGRSWYNTIGQTNVSHPIRLLTIIALKAKSKLW